MFYFSLCAIIFNFLCVFRIFIYINIILYIFLILLFQFLTPPDVCGNTESSIPMSREGNLPKCIICLRRFHRKYSLPINTINTDLDNNMEFTCSACRGLMFAFYIIESGDLVDLFNENVFMGNILLKK